MRRNQNGGFYLGVLTFLTVLCLCAIAMAAESGTWGKLDWKLDNSGNLTISGSGDMDDFPWETPDSTDAWKAYSKEIKSVKIARGVTSIGDYAFYECKSLARISIPDTVTKIGSESFLYCSSLRSITIPSSVKELGRDTFILCGLTSLTIPGTLTDLGYCSFEDCDSLTSLFIGEGITDTAACTFSNCARLRQVRFPDSLKKIGWMAFATCSSLESIIIPKNVETIGESAFIQCGAMKSVILPKSLKKIQIGAFSECDALKDVYYAGSEADRKNILIDTDNDLLLNATWHYNAPEPSNDLIDISSAKVSIQDQIYTGNTIEPKITVTIGGNTLAKEKDYTVAFKHNKYVGTATATVSGINHYKGTIKTTFAILPQKVILSSVKAGDRMLTVKWEKGKSISGYEVECGLRKSFKNAKKTTVSDAATTSAEIRNLKRGRTYYVRVRSFRKVGGRKYYSAWSKTLSKKTE